MGEKESILRIAVPKGKLQKPTADLLARAGIRLADYDSDKSRSYRPEVTTDQPELTNRIVAKVLKPQEIPILVSRGVYDLGISGRDWYHESLCERNVADLLDLGFGRVDLVLAVPETFSDVTDGKTLFEKFKDPKHPLRIWTEYLNLAEKLATKYSDTEPTVISPYRGVSRERHSTVVIYHSFGATESKPPEDGEAIIDNTQTGQTLRANQLKIVETVLPGSTALLLANRRALLDKTKSDLINIIREGCESILRRSQFRSPRMLGHGDW